MKLVSIGDCVADGYLDEGVFYPGGQAVNVAANAMLDGAEKASFLGILAISREPSKSWASASSAAAGRTARPLCQVCASSMETGSSSGESAIR